MKYSQLVATHYLVPNMSFVMQASSLLGDCCPTLKSELCHCQIPSAQLDGLAEILSTCAVGRVGISPEFTDLHAAPQALTLAQMALSSSLIEDGVTIFDRSSSRNRVGQRSGLHGASFARSSRGTGINS